MSTVPAIHLKDPTEIKAWLDQYCECSGPIRIDSTGGITVEGDLKIFANVTQLPVQFLEVTQNVYLRNLSLLRTLKGLPLRIGKDLTIEGCHGFTDFTDGPAKLGGDCIIQSCQKFKSFKGFPTAHYCDLQCEDCPNLIELSGLNNISKLDLYDPVGLITDWDSLPTTIIELVLPKNCPDIPMLPDLSFLAIRTTAKMFPSNTLKWLANKQDLIVSTISETPRPKNVPEWLQLLQESDLLEKMRLFEQVTGEVLWVQPETTELDIPSIDL